jgi:hypothetical protein
VLEDFMSLHEWLGDPIFTPLFTAAIAAAGGTASVAIGGITINIAAVLSAVTVTAIGIGLVLLFSPRPKPESGAIPVQQTTPYRIFAYGVVRMSGAVMLKENANGPLNYVAALCAHRISRFNQLYMNDDLVTIAFDSFNRQFAGNIGAGFDGRYAGDVGIQCRLGRTPEVPYSLTSNLWGTSYRGDGISSIAMVCTQPTQANFTKIFPFSGPAPSVVIRSARLFDPRPPEQHVDDPESWAFSQNVALAILHHQCFSDFGAGRNYQTAVLPVLDYWIQAANDCDDFMPVRGGGSERRYELGFFGTTEQDQKTTLQTMLNACDGHFVERGDGTIILRVGKYVEPTVVISDADIIGFQIQSAIASEDAINQASAKYSSPDAGFVTVETDPVINFADQAARPGAPHVAQFDLGAVQSTGQASRLLNREMIRQAEQIRGKLWLRLSGLNCAYERFVKINSNTVPYLADTAVEIRRAVISLQSGTVEIDFLGTGPSIDTFDPGVDGSTPPYVPRRSVELGLPTPGRVRVIPSLDSNGGVFFGVSWDDMPSDLGYSSYTWTMQWRVPDVGGGVPGSWGSATFISPTSVNQRFIEAIPPNEVDAGFDYEVQVFSVASGDSLSTSNIFQKVGTKPEACAPARPTGLACAVLAPGLVQATGNQSTSPNAAFVRLFRSAAGDSFDMAVPCGPMFRVAVGSFFTTNDNPPGGHFSYWLASYAENGVGSDSLAPVDVFAPDPSYPAPTGLTAAGSTDGSGGSPLTVVAPNATDIYVVQFYVVASGGGFAAAVPVGPQLGALPGETIGYADTQALGDWDYYATAFSRTLAESAPEGPVSVTLS